MLRVIVTLNDARRTTLACVAEAPMSRDEALALCARFPIGSSIKFEYRRDNCKRCKDPAFPGHGPYWSATVRSNGRMVHLHVSASLKPRIDAAWDLITRERATLEAVQRERVRAIEQSPEGRALAELDRLAPAKAKRRRKAAGVAYVAVFDPLAQKRKKNPGRVSAQPGPRPADGGTTVVPLFQESTRKKLEP